MADKQPTLSKQDMGRAMKYAMALAGAIIAVGLLSYAIIPYGYNNIRPTYPELYYTVIFYFPIYMIAVIAVAGYYWVRHDSKKAQPAQDNKPQDTK